MSPAFGRRNGQAVEKLTGPDRAIAVQRSNEDRKLLHRQQTAQKLRDLSELNGNENLANAADRMDQKALDHYENRNQKIDELANRKLDQPLDENALADPLDRPLTDEQISQIEDPRLAREHRLMNEERKLQHQLDVAQQLRDLAAKNGNQNLVQTAERMELTAADRYVKQLEKINQPLTPTVPAAPGLPTPPAVLASP